MRILAGFWRLNYTGMDGVCCAAKNKRVFSQGIAIFQLIHEQCA